MPEALNYNYSTPNNSKAFETRTIKALEVDYVSSPFAQTIFIDENAATQFTATPDEGTVLFQDGWTFQDTIFTLNKTFGSTSYTYTIKWGFGGYYRVDILRTAGSGTTSIKNQDGDFCRASFDDATSPIAASGSIGIDRFYDSGGSPTTTKVFPTNNLREQEAYITIEDGGLTSPPTQIPAVFPPARPTDSTSSKAFDVNSSLKQFDFDFGTLDYSDYLADRGKIWLTPDGFEEGWRNGAQWDSKTAYCAILKKVDSATAGKVDVTFYVTNISGASSQTIAVYPADATLENEDVVDWLDDGIYTFSLDEGDWQIRFRNGSFWNILMLEFSVARGQEYLGYDLTYQDDGGGFTETVPQEIAAGTYDVRFIYRQLTQAANSRYDYYSIPGTEIVIGANSPCPSTYPQDRRNRELQGLF